MLINEYVAIQLHRARENDYSSRHNDHRIERIVAQISGEYKEERRRSRRNRR